MRGLSLCSLLVLLHQVASSALHRPPISRDVVRRQSPSNGSVLVDFQVYKPVPVPSSGVQQVLVDHVFGYSYGAPYVGNYTPPSIDFNSVVFNLTVTSRGRQYDRLGILYLGDIEIWRTTTSEPTATGIIWTYTKDVSEYLSLWKEPQTIIFDLGNIVDSTYTGSFNTTLTATFFNQENAPPKADLILPISSEQGSSGSASVFTVPSDNASVQQTLPLDTSRAFVSLSATGQSNEEFWYTSVLQSDVNTFADVAGTLTGYGPFREVQLYIDGTLAGVAWPFPIIFTGGIVPGFWRPIAGIDAYDLREYEVEITPFLPYLLDGNPHTYEIRIAGLDDNGGNGPATISESSVDSYWLITGKIFVFAGGDNYTSTTHPLPQISGLTPDIHTTHTITTTPNGTNSSLAYTVNASRNFSVTSSTHGTFSQSLTFSNVGYLDHGGLFQINTQHTDGTSQTVDLRTPIYNSHVTFSYPITVNSSYGSLTNGVTIDATIDRTLDISTSGPRPDISLYTWVAGPATLATTQNGIASYSSVTNNSYSYGNNMQTFSETSYGTTYDRTVHAINTTIVEDSVYGTAMHNNAASLYSTNTHGSEAVRPVADGDGRGGVRAFLGRGPGSSP